MKKLFCLVTAILVMVLASMSCSAASAVEKADSATRQSTGSSGESKTYSAPGVAVTKAAPATTTVAAMTIVPSTSGSAIQWNSAEDNTASSSDRMVIRTGNMQIVVSDVTAAIDNISKIAADLGGYVVASQKWKENERNYGSISIRVAADNYDQAIASLRALAVSVTQESTSAEDVTEEYTDLTSRLKNLEATEAQLLEIMKTTTKTEDVLSVQRELTEVRGEIEQAKGRMLYLERTSSTSLIQVQLNESIFGLKFSADMVRLNANEAVLFTPEISGGFSPYNYQWDFGDGETSVEVVPSHVYQNPGIYSVQLIVTDDKGYTNEIVRDDYISVIRSWNPATIAGSAWHGFLVFGKVFLNILIWLAVFCPVWIIIGGIVWFAVYRKRRKVRSIQSNPQPIVEKNKEHQ